MRRMSDETDKKNVTSVLMQQPGKLNLAGDIRLLDGENAICFFTIFRPDFFTFPLLRVVMQRLSTLFPSHSKII